MCVTEVLHFIIGWMLLMYSMICCVVDVNCYYLVGMPAAPRQKFRKGDQTPRVWTLREEEILAATLLELKSRDWVSDKGFRDGYLGIIEDRILRAFPNSDIKRRPHMTSKISSWKESYNSLRQILGRTGVGRLQDSL